MGKDAAGHKIAESQGFGTSKIAESQGFGMSKIAESQGFGTSERAGTDPLYEAIPLRLRYAGMRRRLQAPDGALPAPIGLTRGVWHEGNTVRVLPEQLELRIFPRGAQQP